MKPFVAIAACFLISGCGGKYEAAAKRQVQHDKNSEWFEAMAASPQGTQRIVSTPPKHVIGAVFQGVVEQRGFDPSAIEQRVAALPQSLSDGGVVSTIVDLRSYDCASRAFDLVPATIWDTVCEKGGRINRYFVSGDPGIPSGTNQILAIRSGDTERFSLHLDEAKELAASLSLPLDDVTQAFDLAWSGHLPRMETVHYFARPGHLLITIHSERGPARPKVQHVIVYWRV